MVPGDHVGYAPGVSELERWNTRFSAPDYIFGTAPNDYLASKAPLLKPGLRALCVADGEGRNSVWLAEQGLKVRAFDLSPVGVGKARRLAAERGVSVDYDISDIYGWRWPKAEFDVVAAIFVQFADPAMRTFMFERIVESMKPRALLIVQGYTPKQLEYKTGGPKQVENMYTPPLLRSAFQALEILEVREHEEIMSEGTQHSGRSALIDLLARKP
jgi:SAM-dependent methyltransferase